LQPVFFDTADAFTPLLRAAFTRAGAMLWHATVLAAGCLAVALVLAARPVFFLVGPERRRFRRLSVYVAAAAVAGMATFSLFPGYVMTAYLVRYCPFTVYVNLVPFAAAFYVLARVSLNCWSWSPGSRELPAVGWPPGDARAIGGKSGAAWASAPEPGRGRAGLSLGLALVNVAGRLSQGTGP
jgi:hypothetical protein